MAEAARKSPRGSDWQVLVQRAPGEICFLFLKFQLPKVRKKIWVNGMGTTLTLLFQSHLGDGSRAPGRGEASAPGVPPWGLPAPPLHCPAEGALALPCQTEAQHKGTAASLRARNPLSSLITAKPNAHAPTWETE